jgi:putative transposase
MPIILDNAPIHRKKRIRELVTAAGHIVLFLPTYSPDLNDIEHDFRAPLFIQKMGIKHKNNR